MSSKYFIFRFTLLWSIETIFLIEFMKYVRLGGVLTIDTNVHE